MPVETVGEALSYSRRVHARCAHGTRERIKSIRACMLFRDIGSIPGTIFLRDPRPLIQTDTGGLDRPGPFRDLAGDEGL